MDSVTGPGDPAAQVSRLRQFLAWLLGLTAGFAALAASAAVALGDLALAAKAVVIVGFLGLLLLARARLNQGQPSVAVTIIIAGLVGVALVAAAMVPAAFPVLAVLPVLAATVALPYRGGEALRRLFIGCGLASTLIIVLGETLASTTTLPPWFFGAFRGAALTTAVALILLLLWQFHQRLSELLVQAQAARQRLAFLAEVSHSLAESLEIETTVGKVAELAVPTLADSCTVALLLPDGRARAVAIVRADPARAALMRDLWERLPPSIDSPGLFGEVLRTGRSVLHEDATTAFDGERDQDLFHQLANRSYMVVPLVAQGRTLGALSFATAESARRLTAADLVLAEEVARRAAVAIDNARLFAAEQQARAVAQAQAQQREEFLAIAAHELRTPLTTVKGYVQRMGRLLRPATVDRERLESTQTALEQQVARLESLIADLLDVARLQQGGPVALRQQTVDLVALAHRVSEQVSDGLDRTPLHHLVVEAPEPVVGCWDGDRLEQVLTNLVSNALKYSPAGGTVRLAVRRQAQEAILSVSDEGVGIAPADRSRLFQPFGRGEQGHDRIQGVGLGLYIAAQIVARHGGTIAVESTPGAGSTFTVHLPLATDD